MPGRKTDIGVCISICDRSCLCGFAHSATDLIRGLENYSIRGQVIASMKRDEQSQADAEHDQRDQKVTVTEDTFCGLEKGHPVPVSRFFMIGANIQS
jgi:hypothetical protein